MKPEIKTSPKGSHGAPLATTQARGGSGKWFLISAFVFFFVGVVVYFDLSKPASITSPSQTDTPEEPAEIAPPVAGPVEEVSEAAPVVSVPLVEEAVETVVAVEPAVPKPVEAEAKPAGLGDEAELVLLGLESGRDEAKERDEELLSRAISGQAWGAYRGLLQKSIRAALAKLPRGDGLNRYDPVWKEPALYQAMLRWQTLGSISHSAIDSSDDGFIKWFFKNNRAMEEFLMTIAPEDDSGKVLDFLVYIWSANTETYEKYFSLALACAVVFDQPMNITHPLGSSESGTTAMVDPVERYLWYVEKNEKSKLAAPVDRSSARDLVWVVCAPVVTSELEWAIDKMHLRRGKWGNAYGMIEYLMERAVDGLNPYEEYSFEEILDEGGICGDQTYFCVNTARAQGIPAIGLSGETSLGGHAWAAIKVDPREWDTGIGRIGGVSKGQANHPQTRGRITEQEIQLWNDRHHQSPAANLAVARHLWIADFFHADSEKEESAGAIRLANRIGPSFVETWAALYSLLEEQTELVGNPEKPGNLEQWKSFSSDMRREFKDNPRMARLASKADLEYIFPYGSANDAKTAFIRERRRIERESGEQMDLIAESLKREADLMLKRGDPDADREIGRLYDGALRDYGSSVTGFKMMAEDYFGFFRDDPEKAAKAARDIELAFKRVLETGTKDWFRAQTETSIYRMICGYYRTAGDPDRAERLEKRLDILMRRAKRGAD